MRKKTRSRSSSRHQTASARQKPARKAAAKKTPRKSAPAARAEQGSFGSPHETRNFPNGRAEILRIGGGEVGRLVFQPGWVAKRRSREVTGAVRDPRERSPRR